LQADGKVCLYVIKYGLNLSACLVGGDFPKSEALMFCSSCGAECALELNYCSRCGANITSVTTPPTQLVPINLTKPALILGATTTILTLGGFALIVTAAINLALVFKNPDPIMMITLFGMATIMVADIMLIRVLSRIVRASLEPKPGPELPRNMPREITRQLSPRLDAVPSVTEHTTRTFSPIYSESVDRGTK